MIILSVLVWNDTIFAGHHQIKCCHHKVHSGASCLWIRECCSHNRPLFMWLSAIFPSLHHGPKNPKTSVTTTQACGSPLYSMLSHPNRPGEALCGVMSWGNFHYQSFPWTCEIQASWDTDKQLTILNEHCPLQPTVIQWRSGWVSICLGLQGQKWLIKRSSFHNQKIWCDKHTKMRVL